mgnify:CR=1 FL=1
MTSSVATALIITAAIAAAWALLRRKALRRTFHFDVGHIAVLAALDAEGPMGIEDILDRATRERPLDRAAMRADLVRILAYCGSAGVVRQVDERWEITPQGSIAYRVAIGRAGLAPKRDASSRAP